VAYEVGNGVTFTGSRRSLDQDCTGFFKSMEHALLFGIGRLGEQEVDFLGFRFIPLVPPPCIDADDTQQGFRESL